MVTFQQQSRLTDHLRLSDTGYDPGGIGDVVIVFSCGCF